MGDFLPYGRQYVDEDDVEAVVEVLRGDWLTTGPAVDAFESELAEVCGTDHAVALNSGTSALHAAYEAAGVGPDTEVVVPPLTFSATANVARELGATVRFADVDAETLTLDPESAREATSTKTRVIAAVDYAGHPADLERIAEVADSVDAVVVEDAAHSLGALYRGDPVGSIADMTCLSFHPVKLITTAEGGAVVTDDASCAGRIARFRAHGIDRSRDSLPDDPGGGGWVYDVHRPGLNYRLSDLHAALGRSQLEKLERFVERRREIARRYRAALDGVEAVRLPPEADWCRHAYHLFVIRLPPDVRGEVYRGFHERGIGVQVHYVPVNMLGAYREAGYRAEDTPVALETYRSALSLPCFPAMADADVDRVVDALTEILADLGL